MFSVSHILRLRRERVTRKERGLSYRLRPLGIGCGLLVCLVIALSLIASTVTYSSLSQDLPSIEALPNLIEPPNGVLGEPTRLYDRTGTNILMSLENPAAAGHEYLLTSNDQKKRLPDYITQATIASADPHFSDHSGFLWEGILSGTHPTLAQRLVVEFLLWDEPPGLRRALRERILSAQITARYGRQKILEWYVNTARYGRYVYGADAAARVYFGKPATNLNLAESAFLAGIAQVPAINPHDSPQDVFEQKNRILELMFQQGFINSDQLSQAMQEKPEIQSTASSPINPAPAFTQFVLDQLSQYLNFDRLSRGGFNVITSLDYDLQLQAACSAELQLARLSSNSASSQSESQSQKDCQAARLLPTVSTESTTSEATLVANVIIQDPQTGQILAMVGDPTSSQSPARPPGHPPGSIFTPFIYLTAFSRGMSPATLLWDIPDSIKKPLSEVANPDGQFHGPVRLRTALANDYLIPAIQVFNQMGTEQVWQTARQLGLDLAIIPNGAQSLRVPLEGGEVIPLELGQAFGTLANQGVLVGLTSPGVDPEDDPSALQPVSILKVEDYQGQVQLNCETPIGECLPSSLSVISPQLVYLVNHILSDETARWPSLGHPNPLEIGRPAAVKNGQTIQGKDAWTIGYTPGLVISTWIGNIDPLSDRVISTNWTAGLWHALMQYAHRDQPVEDWPVPAGISEIQVCDPSGMLPTPYCPEKVNEVFLSGNEPTVADNLFHVFQVNRETGRLATLLTPAELVDEIVYMVPPAEAQTWAQQSGIPSAPQAYDVIDFSIPTIPDLAITSPQAFSSVGGEVGIEGRATGKDFVYYRLQAGQGLNPTRWLQVGEDIHTPVENGKLAVWDTNGLSGLYALQLLVVNKDETVQSTTVQVTIDNQAPEVSIRYPDNQQLLESSLSETITFQVEARDDLENVTVQFLLDDELLETRSIPPFVTNWSVKTGRHVLTAIATDRAGNTAQDQIEFTIQP